MQLEEKTLTQKYLYKGKIVRLRLDTAQLPDGKEALREVVEHPGGVCIAALTDREELLFVRQFRYPYGEVIAELPAGKLDGKGEDPLCAARRELKEETGATADCIESLGELYPTPGYCDEIIRLYLATGLHFGEAQPDEDEFLEVERIPLREAVQMVLRGELKDAKTQTAVLKVFYMKG